MASRSVRVIDVGRTADYWQATQMILRGEIRLTCRPRADVEHLVRNQPKRRSRAHRDQGPVYIGSSSGARTWRVITGPTVVGRNCIIERARVSTRASSATTRGCQASPTCERRL